MSHPKPNFDRMIQLIDEVFATRNDPDQIQVSQKQMQRLQEIHPATFTGLADDNGPVIWLLLIPTTQQVMAEFLKGGISEKQLLEKTKPGQIYNCIYLCSATTLPQYRNKGETKRLCLQAIDTICKDHPIRTLFVWPFSEDGEKLAEALAKQTGLLLLKKPNHYL